MSAQFIPELSTAKTSLPVAYAVNAWTMIEERDAEIASLKRTVRLLSVCVWVVSATAIVASVLCIYVVSAYL